MDGEMKQGDQCCENHSDIVKVLRKKIETDLKHAILIIEGDCCLVLAFVRVCLASLGPREG